ncbi:MAG: hypothetical protein K0U68_01950 [Gammaproteobacteria bacterium]|nr:hypothetical protein [Gammaproteobacteria bacterium]
MKKSVITIIMSVLAVTSLVANAEGTRISDTTVDISTKNSGSSNSSISSRRTIVSIGAVNLEDSHIRDSDLIITSVNENSSNYVENGRGNTVAIGSLTAQ